MRSYTIKETRTLQPKNMNIQRVIKNQYILYEYT